MTFTTHGHHIPGTIKDMAPGLVSRCGGVLLCTKCKMEAAQAKNETHATDAMKKREAFETLGQEYQRFADHIRAQLDELGISIQEAAKNLETLFPDRGETIG